MKRVAGAFAAGGLLLLSGLFCLLPRAWAHFVGRRLGRLAYFVSRRSRETALENLRLRLQVDQKEARRIAMASLMQAGASVADLLRAPRMTRRIVDRDLEITGKTRELLAELRRSPRGTVLAATHLGNWEFLNLACRYLSVRKSTVVVVRPPPYPLVARILARWRGATGQKVIHRSDAILRSYPFVRDGGGAVMVFDVPVPPQAGARPVEFFGLPTFTTLAPGHLAARTGAALVLAYSLPLGQHRYRLILRRIEAPKGPTTRDTALALTKQLSKELEAAIRDYPEAWAWWLKRWNIRPAGMRAGWPTYSRDETRHLPGGRIRPD